MTHLPLRMTEADIELGKWVADHLGLEGMDSREIMSLNAPKIITVGPDDLLPECMQPGSDLPPGCPSIPTFSVIADLESWRTYGVLRGVLAKMSPTAEVVTGVCGWRTEHLIEEKLGPDYIWSGYTRDCPSMIAAVVVAIKYLTEVSE